MAVIECFIVIMYSKECGAKSVNEARHHLFTTGQKATGQHSTYSSIFIPACKASTHSSNVFVGVRLLLFGKIYPISVNGAGIKTAELNGNPYGLL